MFLWVEARLKPREQGDIGELSAMEWLASQGAHIYVPVGHSPDVDLIAAFGERLLRVEVKTSSNSREHSRWQVLISTRGGNQSWNGTVKYFDPRRCDYLFVHVGDGRRWFIPTHALECRSGLTLGGAKYGEFEVESGRPLPAATPDSDRAPLKSTPAPGVYRSGQTGGAVNAMALSFAGSNPAAPIDSRRVDRPKFERSLARSGQAIVWPKRRLTLPVNPFDDARLGIGDRMRVRADGPGRLVLERIEPDSTTLALDGLEE
jgi:Holliday junction resolvase-like predicted endonuclease